KHEHAMVRNILRLDDRPVGTLMVPRGDVVYLDVDRPLAENLQRVVASGHARFPLSRSGLQDVLGIVCAKRLLAQMVNEGEPDLAALTEPATFVPEGLSGLDLLQQFQESHSPMVLVVDEFGDVQ